MILPILTYPNKLLRDASVSPLATPSEADRAVKRARELPPHPTPAALQSLVSDLFETMYNAGGVGLAAIQVGVPWRVFVLDCGAAAGPEVFVDPAIETLVGPPELMKEGCLSFPGIYENVQRHTEVRGRAHRADGSEFWFQKPPAIYIDREDPSPNADRRRREAEAETLRMHVVQHEVEHLNGVILSDKLSSTRKTLMEAKLRKLRKASR